MYVGISIVVDHDSQSKMWSMVNVSKLLESFFKDKYYGAINHYWIVCTAVGPEYEYGESSKTKRPMFKEVRRFREPDGSMKDYYGVYTCEFKLDIEEYNQMMISTDKEVERMIARKVVDSLSNLDRLSKKATTFDKERFKSDMIQLFKDNNLI